MQPLVAGPRSGLSESTVLDALNTREGFDTRWGCDLLHTDDLTDTGIALDLISGDVTWSYRAEWADQSEEPAPGKVRRSAHLTFADLPGFNALSVFYRPWIELRAPGQALYPADDMYPEDDLYPFQGGVWVRWHLGVFTSLMPPMVDDGHLVTRPLELADKTHLYASRQLDEPLTVPSGTVVTSWIADDLQVRFREPDVSRIEPSVSTLSQSLTFEPGAQVIDVYNTLLSEIGYGQIHCDEDGLPVAEPLVDPQDREDEWPYEPGTTMLRPARLEAVNPDLPNVVRFVAKRRHELAAEGSGIRTVVNQSTGPGSIQQRGRTVIRRVEIDADTQAELDAHAKHRSQFLFGGGGHRWNGRVALNPAHSDEDRIRLVKPHFGVAGGWLVTRWSHRFGGMSHENATTEVTAERVSGAAFATELPARIPAFATHKFATRKFAA